MDKEHAAEIWDFLTATQRRAIIRMTYDYELTSVAKVEQSSWERMTERDRLALLKYDWEFCLGVKFN